MIERQGSESEITTAVVGGTTSAPVALDGF